MNEKYGPAISKDINKPDACTLTFSIRFTSNWTSKTHKGQHT